MNIRIKKLIYLFLSCLATTAYAQEPTSTPASISTPSSIISEPTSSTPSVPTKQFVQQIIKPLMQKYDISGVAVEIYIDGKPKSYYFGEANPNKKISVSRNTIFEIGSITKVMTSFLIAKQVDAAKIQLNESITKYIFKSSDGLDDINFQDLATHTSGLPFKAPDNIKNKKALETYFNTWTTDNAPGEYWIYSNLGISLLGDALEKITHQSIDELYRRQLLKPLHMQLIGMTVPAALKKYYAQGFDKNGQPVPPMTPNLYASAGDMKASSGDMQQFLAAAIGLPGTPQRVLYPMRMTQAAYVKLSDYMQGLGWQIYPLSSPEEAARLLDIPENLSSIGPPIVVEEVFEKPIFNGDRLIDKTGGTDGFRAYILLIPNKKSGVVILANKFIPGSAIMKAGREILFQIANVAVNTTSHEAVITEAS